MTGTKKLYVKTYGCQMNVYDSERMAEALGAEGYETVDRPEAADMILLNTCHIREKAAEKVYSELGRFKPLREANPDLKIGVAGCVAQAEGEEIMRRQPMVDLVVGPASLSSTAQDDGGAWSGREGARHRLPRGGQVRPSAQGPADAARSDGVPDRAGRLRQVLFLLRRSLYPRRRGFAPGRAASGRGTRPRGAWRA
jgi:hypothetical protein